VSGCYLSRGKELPDPAKLLRKAGGETRWIDLEAASTLASPEVQRLIERQSPSPHAIRTHRSRLGDHEPVNGQEAPPGLTCGGASLSRPRPWPKRLHGHRRDASGNRSDLSH